MDLGDWVVVSVAVVLTGTAVGVLLTLPVWSGSGRPRLVPALLTIHAGVVAVIGVVTTAAAIRSWQVVGRPPADTAEGLLDVSRIDGDGSLFALLVLLLAFGTLLAVAALALAARFAAGHDPTERMLACGVLGLEICVGGYGAAQLLGGNHGIATLLVTAQLPLGILAMVVCWPPVDDEGRYVGASR